MNRHRQVFMQTSLKKKEHTYPLQSSLKLTSDTETNSNIARRRTLETRGLERFRVAQLGRKRMQLVANQVHLQQHLPFQSQP